MTKSVKPIQSTTYDLQPASNPIYFENGTDLTVSGGAGVFGASGTTWMVTNAGTIASTNLSREGAIQVVGAGDVTNDASGVVTASGSYARAVYLGGDGQITNAGLLAGYGTHVQGILTKGNVTATNTGTIKVETGSGQAHASGVNLQDGGSFTNEVGGAVYAYGYHVAGVQAYLTGSVTNYGSITAKTNASGHAAAVQLDANGTLVNEVGGKISASGTHALGVEMLSGGTTTNYGSISAASGGPVTPPASNSRTAAISTTSRQARSRPPDRTSAASTRAAAAAFTTTARSVSRAATEPRFTSNPRARSSIRDRSARPADMSPRCMRARPRRSR
jgi:hypothetical protein